MNTAIKLIFICAMAVMPAPQANAKVPKLPKPEKLEFNPPKGSRIKLDNGLIIYMLEDHSLPSIRLGAVIRAGSMYDPKEKIGLARLAGKTMRYGGTSKYPADAMSEILENLGASVETSINFESGSADMFCLSRDFDRVFDIFADVLKNPAFDKDKVDIKRHEMLEMINRRNDDPQEMAFREATRAFYGAGHPYGWRQEKSTVENITRDDLPAFHSRYYKPNAVMLIASGDFKSAEMESKIREKFADWQKQPLDLPNIAPVSPPKDRAVYAVEKDIPQPVIIITQKGIMRHDPGYFNLETADTILGTGLDSRLYSEIRSRRGLAYYAYSGYTLLQDYGMIYAACGTNPQSAGQVIEELLRQFALLKTEPVAHEELIRAKAGIINSFVFKFKTADKTITERAMNEYYGYAPDYLDTYLDKIREVTENSILTVMNKTLTPGSAMIFAVGNHKNFDKPLSAFGEVKTLTPD